MTSFVFVGDPRMNGRDATERCEIFGHVFPSGVPVTVNDDAVAARLRRHSHFAEVADDDHNDKGLPDAADPTSGLGIEALRAKADELGINHEGVKKGALRDLIREKMAG